MASHASSRRWLLRQLRPTFVVLVSVGFIFAILTYFVDWPTFINSSKLRREGAAQPKSGSLEQRYTGSIIVPTGEGLCWRYIFDNRTGNLRYGGHPRCVEAMGQFKRKNPRESLDALRLREVGKAFRHESN
jgi:hypothetical protein